jgi:hypothetical protein
MSLYSVKEMAMRYPAFPEGSLRWLIFNADKNGFDKCVFRPPGIRKVLIDELEFLKWLKSNSDKATEQKPLPPKLKLHNKVNNSPKIKEQPIHVTQEDFGLL